MFLISNEYWEIRKTRGKGHGVFALKDISEGLIIGDYLGKILRPEEVIVDEENFYLMYYHDHAVISPELEKIGVHLINHSCVPNSFPYIYKGHTLAFARKKIKEGEEITIPYLLPPIDKNCHPCLHVCKCKNLNCSGTMHMSKEKYKIWRRITDKQSRETNRERIRYGKNLNRFLVYPKIPQSYIQDVQEIL